MLFQVTQEEMWKILHINKFLQEQQDIKEKINEKDVDPLEVTERCQRTFRFAAYARWNFLKGDKRTQRIILSSLGSNLTLKDRKLGITPWLPYYLIKSSNGGNGCQNGGLEPSKSGIQTGRKDLSVSAITNWNRTVEAVRTWMKDNFKTFWVPDLEKPSREKAKGGVKRLSR